MDRLVLICGEAVYFLVSGELERGEFCLIKLEKKYLIDKVGYFYFLDDGSLVDEDSLAHLFALAHIMNERVPQLNRVKS